MQRRVCQQGGIPRPGVAARIQHQEQLIAQQDAVAQGRGIPAERFPVAEVRVQRGEARGVDLADVVVAGEHIHGHTAILRVPQLRDERLVLGELALVGDVPQQQQDIRSLAFGIPQEGVDDLQVIRLQRIDIAIAPEGGIDVQVSRAGDGQRFAGGLRHAAEKQKKRETQRAQDSFPHGLSLLGQAAKGTPASFCLHYT